MNSYKYVGVELTPNIFSELLIKFFDGKQFKRQTAIDTIVSFHKEHGGLINKGEYISVFKKASQKLQKYGLSNVGYGTWRLNYQIKEIEVVQDISDEKSEINADKTIGNGDNAVYVYYYDIYKKSAEQSGMLSWECKIGRTDKEPLQRILGQAGTSYPEYPHVALVIFCDNSGVLETAIHSALKLRGKHLDKAPGNEWFLTSPEEVETIYLALMNNE